MDEKEKISRKIRSMKKYVDFLNLQNNLEDLNEFAKFIARYLEKEEK